MYIKSRVVQDNGINYMGSMYTDQLENLSPMNIKRMLENPTPFESCPTKWWLNSKAVLCSLGSLFHERAKHVEVEWCFMG